MKPGAPTAHADALLSAVKAAVGSKVAVHLDQVPDDPALPYVVVWSDSALSRAESLGATNERAAFHPALTVAGQDALRVRMVRDRLEALYDADVTVEGRLCELEKLSSTSITRDDAIPDRLVYWCRDTLELRSYAA